MDDRVTRTRLKNTLAYDWFKIIIFIVLIAILIELIFTVFADRISSGEEFIVYSYDMTMTGDINDQLVTMKDDQTLSYDIRKYSYSDFGIYSSSNTVVSQQLSAYSAVGQGDILYVSDVGRETVNEDTEEVSNDSVLCSMATSGYLYDFDNLMADARKYCESVGSFSGDIDNIVYNETKVRDYFESRMKKDNRYKKGMINSDMEVARLVKLWKNVLAMETLMETDELFVSFNAIAARDTDGKTEGREQRFGINLGYLSGGEKKITDLCYPVDAIYDGDSVTGNGGVIAVFNYLSFQEDLMFETVCYITSVISDYSNLLDAFKGKI